MAHSKADNPLIVALVALTFTTGLIDAASYIGLGRVFVANMTGNVALLGFAAAGIPGLSVTRSLLSLVAFLLGAAAALASSGYTIDTGKPVNRVYVMIALTAVAMGLRNATVHSLKVPDLSTTVVTLTLTGLAADSSLGGGDSPRLVRRIASVVVLFAGAATGAFLLRYGLALPLFITAACVLVTSRRTRP
jgi:uncharacterized membrane protein YoaK (UPF0700 family)